MDEVWVLSIVVIPVSGGLLRLGLSPLSAAGSLGVARRPAFYPDLRKTSHPGGG